MGEPKEISIDTTVWSDLPREYSCSARHGSQDEIKKRSSRDRQEKVMIYCYENVFKIVRFQMDS